LFCEMQHAPALRAAWPDRAPEGAAPPLASFSRQRHCGDTTRVGSDRSSGRSVRGQPLVRYGYNARSYSAEAARSILGYYSSFAPESKTQKRERNREDQGIEISSSLRRTAILLSDKNGVHFLFSIGRVFQNALLYSEPHCNSLPP